MKERVLVRDLRGRPRKPQILLDGLIIYGQELGDLGKQLERLLRRRGVRSSMDAAIVSRYH